MEIICFVKFIPAGGGKDEKNVYIITDGKEGYDAKFNMEKGKVVYQEYNQEIGKSKTKRAEIL